jgi:hypothetical protein
LRLFVLFTAWLVGLASADSLVYGRQAVVVTSLESSVTDVRGAAALSSRAVEVLKSATFDRDWTVGAWLASHPLAQRKLERMTLPSERLGTKFLSDGAVSTEFEFSLVGAVLNLILPPVGDGRLLGRTACPTCGQAWPEGKEAPEDVALVPYETGVVPEYSGILVDASGLSLAPALFPRVVTESGDAVTGPEFTDADHLARCGQAGYYGKRSEALSSERVGPNPLLVRALSVAGSNLCDPVVSAADAARIHGSAANLKLLKECRIGFLAE